jgi:hypothetical protein
MLASGSDALAQNPEPEVVPLHVQVTISRYQEAELISSLPYMLSATANDRFSSCSLRMGADVPVPTISMVFNQAGEETPRRSFNYRNVGTNIDCQATTVSDDRYQLLVNIEESSVYGDDQTPTDAFGGQPVFRSFQSSNTMILRDGQSRQYTAAADRITGESIRVDVTLTVLE